MRAFVNKKKEKWKQFYNVKHKTKKHNFHLEEEFLSKTNKMGNTCPIPSRESTSKDPVLKQRGTVMEKLCSEMHHITQFITEEIIQWSMLRYETQKVAQQQQTKLYQRQMYRKDPYKQLQGRHRNALGSINKKFVMLSRFWPLRGWVGGGVE